MYMSGTVVLLTRLGGSTPQLVFRLEEPDWIVMMQRQLLLAYIVLDPLVLGEFITVKQQFPKSVADNLCIVERRPVKVVL